MRTKFFSFLLCALCLFVALPARHALASSPPSLVLSEVAWSGSSLSDADEWIEIANVGATEVSLEGWTLVGATGATPLALGTGTLAPQTTLLISNYAQGNVKSALMTDPQIVTTAVSLPNSGLHLALHAPDGTVIDMAEGNASGTSGETRASMERIAPEAAATSWQTAMLSQNLAQPNLGSPGIITLQLATDEIPPDPEVPETIQKAPQPRARTIPNRPPYRAGDVLINEFSSDPAEGEEWIELRNQLKTDAWLDGYWIEDDAGRKTTLSGLLMVNGYFVIEKPKGALNNSGDSIKLFAPDATLIDEVSYGAADSPAPTPKDALVAARDYATHVFSLTETPTRGGENIIKLTPPVVKTESAKTSETPPAHIPVPATTTLKPQLSISGPMLIYVDQPSVFSATLSPPSPSDQTILWVIDHEVRGRGTSFQFTAVRTGKVTVRALVDGEIGFLEDKRTVEVFKLPGTPVTQVATTLALATKPAPAAKRTAPAGTARSPVAKRSSVGVSVVEGVVTVEPGVLGTQYFYLDNGSQIYLSSKQFPALTVGDRVRVNGTRSKTITNRVLVKRESDIRVLDHAEPPAATSTSGDELGEEELGKLVTLHGTAEQILTGKFILNDGTENAIAVKKSTGIPNDIVRDGDEVELTGIVETNTTGVKIVPRNSDDIRVVKRPTPTVLVAGTATKRSPLAATGSALVIAMGSVLATLAAQFSLRRVAKRETVAENTYETD